MGPKISSLTNFIELEMPNMIKQEVIICLEKVSKAPWIWKEASSRGGETSLQFCWPSLCELGISLIY